MLTVAHPDSTPAELRALVVEENVTGKRSESTRKITWKHLRPRYVLDLDIPEYRAFFAGVRTTSDPAERGLLCFLMFARCDRLLREVTLECISPHLHQPGTLIDPAAVMAAIDRRAAAAEQRWSESVRRGLVQHLLSTLKDFGVIAGSLTRRTVRLRPGVQTTLFAARLARLEGLTDRQVLDATWFRLLGLRQEQVSDLLYAAARGGVLRFRTQADVVELSLPEIGGQA